MKRTRKEIIELSTSYIFFIFPNIFECFVIFFPPDYLLVAVYLLIVLVNTTQALTRQTGFETSRKHVTKIHFKIFCNHVFEELDI